MAFYNQKTELSYWYLKLFKQHGWINSVKPAWDKVPTAWAQWGTHKNNIFCNKCIIVIFFKNCKVTYGGFSQQMGSLRFLTARSHKSYKRDTIPTIWEPTGEVHHLAFSLTCFYLIFNKCVSFCWPDPKTWTCCCSLAQSFILSPRLATNSYCWCSSGEFH